MANMRSLLRGVPLALPLISIGDPTSCLTEGLLNIWSEEVDKSGIVCLDWVSSSIS